MNGIISTLKIKHSSVFYICTTTPPPFKPCPCFSSSGWKTRRWRKGAQPCCTASWRNPTHPWSGGKEIRSCSRVTSTRSGKRGHALSSSSMTLRLRMPEIIRATRGISRPPHRCKSKVGEASLEGREVTALAVLHRGDKEVLSLNYHQHRICELLLQERVWAAICSSKKNLVPFKPSSISAAAILISLWELGAKVQLLLMEGMYKSI